MGSTLPPGHPAGDEAATATDTNTDTNRDSRGGAGGCCCGCGCRLRVQGGEDVGAHLGQAGPQFRHEGGRKG